MRTEDIFALGLGLTPACGWPSITSWPRPCSAWTQAGRCSSLHLPRHPAASVAMENPDVSLLDVKGLLRHQNLTTTQRYVHRM